MFSLKLIKQRKNIANRKFGWNPSVSAFSPSVSQANKASSYIFSAVKQFANLEYVFQSLYWCISKGPTNTGVWFVALFSKFKCLYVVTVRLILSSNMLNVGSAQNVQNSWVSVQNWTNSNWQSEAGITRKSGCTLHSLIKMDDFAMLSSLFAFWSNIRIASLIFSLHFFGYSTDGDPKK